MESKDTNPKDAIGVTKAPCSVVPGPFVFGVGLAMLEGACKYGRHNYREAGVRASIYFDALQRHIWAWWEGEDIDPVSGLPHVIKAAACLAVIYDAMHNNKWSDDRPPKLDASWVEGMNQLTKTLLDKFPNPKAPVTALSCASS